MVLFGELANNGGTVEVTVENDDIVLNMADELQPV